MISRRQLLPVPAILLLAQCANGSSAVTLQQVQSYANDLVDALSAAAQAYLASPSATNASVVQTIVSDLQTAKTALNAVTSQTNAQSIALQVVGFAQQLEPIVLPFLGVAAPYIPIAIAVIQAFIQSLPPPPATPATPPAQLHAVAVKYRLHMKH